jgi:transposase
MARHFRPCGNSVAIFLYRDPVDFRKQSAGLAAIVEQELDRNPFDGGLYAFTNRQRNKIKCLYWENNGFVLYYKSLAEEKFHWPSREEKLVSLNVQQINWLLDGYNINAMKAHKKLYYESVF